ncbi:(Uracil-5)-methyltransferase [Thermodesulfobium narugense DSM 14796]|uniref:(Uracil-5)-methyltransferase n=1 Tax=Thermodesulfobium narugense DSM 14796 TaxID=747365 RepID=M1E5V6_9BACT|nr:RsmD family RNA methyltransferase [Thermodesulfobium narugense]AEE15292.1 (Uracil-5)-methyltransferase [Thermodesulfobium narugense DSM 14796]
MQFLPIKFEKIVSSGRALGRNCGKVVFCYGVLPGEVAEVRFVREKKDYIEAELVNIIEPSRFRILPKENHYLSCSPWQTIDYEYQIELKKGIIEEGLFQTIRKQIKLGSFYKAKNIYGYRTKIEYRFENTNSNLNYAFYKRGTKDLVILENGCKLIDDRVNYIAYSLLDYITSLDIDKRALDKIVFRNNTNGLVLGIIYLSNKSDILTIPKIENLAGLVIDGANSRQIFGQEFLEQDLLGTKIKYGYDCFFQNNIELFSKVLEIIRNEINSARKIVDLYSGVGSIGLSLRDLADKVVLIESFRNSNLYSIKNIKALGAKNVVPILSNSETISKDILQESDVVILDPPRDGAKKILLDKLLKNLPKKICYLSCNPITLGRDLSFLLKKYDLKKIYGFDFFPNTVHAEVLAFLER